MKTFKKWLACLAVPMVVVVALAAWQGEPEYDGGGCPPVDPIDHSVLLPNPNDCSSFFMCSEGAPILQECPDGLWFNPFLCVCDWPNPEFCYEEVPSSCIKGGDDCSKVVVTPDGNYVVYYPGYHTKVEIITGE